MNDLGIPGLRTPESAGLEVRRAQLQTFAALTGEVDPIYTKPIAAQAAGLPDLPVPAAFLLSIEYGAPTVISWILGLDLDLSRMQHGDQTFRYHRLAFAGDVLTYTPVPQVPHLSAELCYVVREATIHRGDDLIAGIRTITVLRRHH